MSYNIGQFRSFDITANLSNQQNKNIIQQYIEKQNIGEIQKGPIISYISGTKFKDPYIENINFNTQKNYYLNFKVKKINSEQVIKLKVLLGEDKEQILQTFNVSQLSDEKDEEFFEIVFSLNDSYNTLVWELTRTAIDDYQHTEPDGTPGRIIEITQCNLYVIKNVLDTLNYNGLQYLTKIGIQGPPLMLMCINKQQIRIGKNGIYELNNGINITFVGFVPKMHAVQRWENNEIKIVNVMDFFIMDFEYQAIENSNSNQNDNDEEIQGGA